MMKMYNICRQGTGHSEYQDALFQENNTIILCDGVSNSPYGRETAVGLANDLGKALSTQDAKAFLATASLDVIKKQIATLIDTSTKMLASKLKCDTDKLASTLIICSIYENTLTVLQAGDGVVFAKTNDNSNGCIIISNPDNHEITGAICSAQSPYQQERMRCLRYSLDNFSYIFFGSDGFTDFFYDNKNFYFDAFATKHIESINSNEELNAFVNEHHLSRTVNIQDDITGVIIKLNDIQKEDKAPSIVIKPNSQIVEDKEEATPKVENNKESKAPKKSRAKGVIITSLILLLCSVIGLGAITYVLATQLDKTNVKLNEVQSQVQMQNEDIDNLESEVIKLQSENIENTNEINDTYDTNDTDNTNNTEDTENINNTEN